MYASMSITRSGWVVDTIATYVAKHIIREEISLCSAWRPPWLGREGGGVLPTFQLAPDCQGEVRYFVQITFF